MVLTLFMLAQREHPDDSKAMETVLEKKDAETSTDPFVGY